METFYLKNNNGEVINKIRLESLGEAIEYFSKIKILDKKELLEIYKVEKDENRSINR